MNSTAPSPTSNSEGNFRLVWRILYAACAALMAARRVFIQTTRTGVAHAVTAPLPSWVFVSSTNISTGLSGRSTWNGAFASSQTSLHLVKPQP